MIRLAHATLLIALLSPFAANPASDQAEAGVVKIETQTSGQAAEVGSGFVVRLEQGRAWIVTAAHVVEGGGRITVQFAPDRLREFTGKPVGKIEAGNPRGMALLSVAGEIPAGVIALPLASGTPLAKGRHFVTIGHPAAGDWLRVEGVVSAIDGLEVTIQAPVEPGNSGGALLVEGAVGGIVIAKAGMAFGRAVDASLVRAFLEGKNVAPGGPNIGKAATISGVKTEDFFLAPEKLKSMSRSEFSKLSPMTGTWEQEGGSLIFRTTRVLHGEDAVLVYEFKDDRLAETRISWGQYHEREQITSKYLPPQTNYDRGDEYAVKALCGGPLKQKLIGQLIERFGAAVLADGYSRRSDPTPITKYCGRSDCTGQSIIDLDTRTFRDGTTQIEFLQELRDTSYSVRFLLRSDWKEREVDQQSCSLRVRYTFVVSN